MNIVESLRKIENQLFYKTGETHNLVGAYLAEDVDKEKVWEMLKSNNVKGIINLLEQAWYDDEWDDRDFATVDRPRNKREQMEYIEKYCDMVDGELVSVNGSPKIVYSDGELAAGSLSELVDMIHKELNEDYEPEWHDTADQEQLDQPDYTPEYVDDDIDCEWWCGLDEKLSEKEIDKYRDLESEYRKLPNQWGGKAKAIMRMMAKLANKMDDDQMRKFVSNKMAMAESLEDLNVLTDDELEQYRITDPDRDRDYVGTMLWEDVNYVEDLFPEISTEDADIISDYVEHLDAHLYLTDDGVIIVQPLAFDSFGYKDLKSFLKDVRYTVNQWEEGDYFDADHAEEWIEKHPYGYYNSENDFGIDESLNEATDFKNFIYDNLLNVADNAEPKLITNYMIKCSKSAIPNALYYVNKGEDVVLRLGNMKDPVKGVVSHVWVEHNGDIIQTFGSNVDQKFIDNYATKDKLHPYISIALVPGDVEASREKIKDKLSKITNSGTTSAQAQSAWKNTLSKYWNNTNESLNESDEKRFNSSREVMEFFYELASMSENPEDAIKKFVDEHKSDPHVEDAYDEWCDMEPY